jgi:hypothetical protein
VRSLPLVALAVALVPGAARPGPPGPPTLDDIVYARSLALSAFRAVVPGNDAIYFNPGGISLRRRFAAEIQGSSLRQEDVIEGQFLSTSASDSTTGAVAGVFAYEYLARFTYTGGVTSLALGGTVGKGLHVGATVHYLKLGGPGGESVQAATVTAGIFYEVSEIVNLGIAGYNLVPTNHDDLVPAGMAGALSVGSDRSFLVAGDWRGQWDAQGKVKNTYAAGAEALLGDMFPVRAGVLKDEWRNGQWWSAGVGLVTSSGVAVDVSYQQAFGFPAYRMLAAGLKIFILG